MLFFACLDTDWYITMDNRDVSRSSLAYIASFPVPSAVLGACKKRKEGKRSTFVMFVKCFAGQLGPLRLLR